MKRAREDVEEGSPFTNLPRELLVETIRWTRQPALAMVCKSWFFAVVEGGIDWFELFALEVAPWDHNPLFLLGSDVLQLELLSLGGCVTEIATLLLDRATKLRQRIGLFLMRALSVYLHFTPGVVGHDLQGSFMFQSALFYLRDVVKRPLALRHFHPRDFRINFFEEGHAYFLTFCEGEAGATALALNVRRPVEGVWNNYLLSVTTLLHELFPPFVEDDAVTSVMACWSWENCPTYRYYHMTAEEIKAKWQEARKLGTAMHANLENYYNGLAYETGTREWGLFCEFEAEWITGKLEPFRTEWLLFHKELRLTGSVDMLYKYTNPVKNLPDANGKIHLVLMDWKRAYDLLKPNNREFGTKPFTADLPNSKISHYELQLQLYKLMLESNYNVVIDSMVIVGLHPSQEKHIKYDVAWDPVRMRKLVAYRKSAVAKLGPATAG